MARQSRIHGGKLGWGIRQSPVQYFRQPCGENWHKPHLVHKPNRSPAFVPVSATAAAVPGAQGSSPPKVLMEKVKIGLSPDSVRLY